MDAPAAALAGNSRGRRSGSATQPPIPPRTPIEQILIPTTG
jgi:hypothetical protein